jgi:Tol biopolymer transport system component
MSGNAWEMVNDWYDSNYYPVSPVENPTGPETGNDTGVRGGSWRSTWPFIRAANRNSAGQFDATDEVGFRCVVVPGQETQATPTSIPIATTTLIGGEPGQIAFTSERDGNAEIYVMNADGSNQTNLINNPANDYNPTWLSEDRQVAFLSDRDGNPEIYVMNSDGTNQARLTTNFDGRNPVWSPDGRYITFESGSEIYAMSADGTNQTRLTNSLYDNENPVWSPDGNHIAFESNRDGNWDIYVMNADGTNQTRLTNDRAYDNHPAWSPDGTYIAFTTFRYGGGEIAVMSSDGTNQVRLTNISADDALYPTWSPDGQRIAFTTYGHGTWVVNADGANQTRLTYESSGGYGFIGGENIYFNRIAWSPDGKLITFASLGSSSWEIYLLNSDGTNGTFLTDNFVYDWDPVWSP